jgi:dihydroflavonol-4-reductase
METGAMNGQTHATQAPAIKPMKMAVIGATGMLGQHVTRQALLRGHQVVVVHRAGSKLDKFSGLAVEPRLGTLDDANALARALKGTDVVVNAAAYYPTTPRPWADDVRLATEQQQRFLAACDQAEVPRVVYLGAAIALARRSDGQAATEADAYPAQPADLNGYLQAKWAMERMAMHASRPDRPVLVGIPAMTFGEFDDGATTGRLLLEVARGTLPAYVRGNRNVVAASDAGRGLVRVAESGVHASAAAGNTRYLITGANTSMDDLVALMARLSGQRMPRAISVGVARLAAQGAALRWRVLGGAAPKLTPSAVAVMASGQFLDGSKAQRELGYTPALDLTQTLERALAWFEQRGLVPQSQR